MKSLWKMLQRVSLWLGLLGVVSLFSGGCQTAKKDLTFLPVPDDGLVESCTSLERVAPGEIITVRLPDSGPHVARVKEDGTVTLPLIGKVEVAGKTPEELQRVVHDLYVPRYYKSLPFSSYRRVYYVSGQVRAPGRQQYIGPTTILKAIASAGDFADHANRKKVFLTRADGQRLVVNCMKAHSQDLEIFPGDKIEVPKRIW